MSNFNDDTLNINHYTSLLREFGLSHESLDWGSRGSQLKRFEVLSKIGIPQGSKILDVGCGLADFYSWLLENNFLLSYTGLDITPEMVRHAQALYPDSTFFTSSLSDHIFKPNSYDFVFASGIFAYRNFNPEQFLFSSIGQMFSIASCGVAFNCLSSWSVSKTAGEFYADPLRTLEFCRTLTSKIVFLHDYHPSDFTIYLYK